MLPYEPGSVMKTFAYAAAIDYGGLDPNDKFDSSNYMIGEKADGNTAQQDSDLGMTPANAEPLPF